METYLTFVLKNEYFAVSVSNVLEVVQKQFVTYVPRAPEHILGIINFRGEIVPVINARTKFNFTYKQENEKHIVIVFETTNNTAKQIVATLADEVKDVISVKKDEIKPVPELGLNYQNNFITGAIPYKENFALLVDIEKVLN